MSLPPDTLTSELYGYLMTHAAEHAAGIPDGETRICQWVMNREWHHEVRNLAVRLGGLPVIGRSEYLMGLPIIVREDGGVPHLEAAHVGDEAPPAT